MLALLHQRLETLCKSPMHSLRLLILQNAGGFSVARRGKQRIAKRSFPRNDLRREPDHWRSFGARISPLTGSPRLAANPPHAILNERYALLPRVDLIEQSRLAVDELIDMAGRPTIEAVLQLSAAPVAGPRTPGQKRTGLL
jgi:hypothetical protein